MSANSPDDGSPPSPSFDLEISGLRKRSSIRKEKLGHRRVNATGTVTYKKKSTEEIQKAIQIGINTSVGSILQKPSYDLLERDFQIIERVDFPQQGSKSTPAHNLSDFRFETYAPEAFRGFRNLFHLNMPDFLNSICSKKLTELSNPGASGSIFYMTNDDEFIIKTVQRKEADFLHRILLLYYINLCQNPRTLLPKYYGLYTYQSGSKNIRFAVMNNLLPSLTIHEKYDLKGSTYKRKASPAELAKKSPTLKDLDFREKHKSGILLEAETYDAFMHTLARDCRLLESLSIMDYSLLLGIHNLDQAKRERNEQAQNATTSDAAGDEQTGSPAKESAEGKSRPSRLHSKRIVTMATVMENILPEAQPVILEEEEQDVIAPGGIPARNSNGDRLLLYVGIIDILQSYRLFKKMEHAFKSIAIDPETFSVTNPKFYAQRFMNNLKKNVFRKASSLDDIKSVGPYKYRFRKIVLEEDSQKSTIKNAPKRRPNSSIPRRSVNTRTVEKDERSSVINPSSRSDAAIKSNETSAETNPMMRNFLSKDLFDTRSYQGSPQMNTLTKKNRPPATTTNDDILVLNNLHRNLFPPEYRGFNSNPYLMKQHSSQPYLGPHKSFGTLSSSLYTPSHADSNNLDSLTPSSCSLVSYDENILTDEVFNNDIKTLHSLIDQQKVIYNNIRLRLSNVYESRGEGVVEAIKTDSSSDEDSDIDNTPKETFRVIRVGEARSSTDLTNQVETTNLTRL